MWPLFKSLLGYPSGRSVDVGTVSDLPVHLRRLIEAPPEGFLIVEVAGLDDAFLQFSAGPDVIQMDHPLLTHVQASREQTFRAACEAVRRPVYDSLGSDGSRFLDCDLPGEPSAAAADVRRVLESLFMIEATTELKFVGDGLPAVTEPRPQ